VVIIGFGLFMLGLLRIPALMRERRLQLRSKPAGKAGSVVAGVAFGAGWTPCIGPVLASLLFYAGFEETMTRGMVLLGAYALGLGIPFFLSAVALNWFLAGASRVKRWIVPIERDDGRGARPPGPPPRLRGVRPHHRVPRPVLPRDRRGALIPTTIEPEYETMSDIRMLNTTRLRTPLLALVAALALAACGQEDARADMNALPPSVTEAAEAMQPRRWTPSTCAPSATPGAARTHRSP
jgi:hypothetical protein